MIVPFPLFFMKLRGKNIKCKNGEKDQDPKVNKINNPLHFRKPKNMQLKLKTQTDLF